MPRLAMTSPAPAAEVPDAPFRRAVRQYERAGQLEPACGVILSAFANGLVTPGLLNDLAALQTEKGDLAAAERSLLVALRLEPGLLSARVNLADLLLLTHRHAEAVAVIRDLLPQLPPAEQQRLRPHVQVTDQAIEPWSPADPGIWAAVREIPGLAAREWRIDLEEFRRFPCAHPWSAAPHYYEKKLQYYLSAAALRLTSRDRFVDIASQGSAFPLYAQRIVGCDVYRQDLLYAPGRERYLAGDAAAMPVPNGFFTAMTLHCSFEHFERDADMRFLREAARVLRPGGRLCIVPLYLSREPEERYNESFANGEDKKAFGPGCEFYRAYSPVTLRDRVLATAAPHFDATLFHTVNLDQIRASLPAHQTLYSHFLLLLTRK